jgi:hypothetical protein
MRVGSSLPNFGFRLSVSIKDTTLFSPAWTTAGTIDTDYLSRTRRMPLAASF